MDKVNFNVGDVVYVVGEHEEDSYFGKVAKVDIDELFVCSNRTDKEGIWYHQSDLRPLTDVEKGFKLASG